MRPQISIFRFGLLCSVNKNKKYFLFYNKIKTNSWLFVFVHKMDIKTKHDCRICHTTDLSKYTPLSFDICKTCKHTYLCSYCGETDKEKFPKDNRYTTCQKCLNKLKNKSRDKKVAEKQYDQLSDENFNKYLKLYLNNDINVFGVPISQRLDEIHGTNQEIVVFQNNLIDSVTQLDNKCEKFIQKFEDNDVITSEFKKELKYILNENKQNNKKIETMENTILELRVENAELRERLANLEEAYLKFKYNN